MTLQTSIPPEPQLNDASPLNAMYWCLIDAVHIAYLEGIERQEFTPLVGQYWDEETRSSRKLGKQRIPRGH